MRYLVLIYIFIVSLGGCSSESTAPAPKLDGDLLLSQHLMLNLMTPKTRNLESSAQNLESSVVSLCEADSVSLQEVRDQWRQTMDQLHYLSVFNFGPLGQANNAEVNLIYSPERELNKEGLIDVQIRIAAKKKGKYKIRTEKPVYMGLDAIEYVLFSRWAERAELDETAEECVYLKYVVKDVRSRIEAVQARWQDQVLTNYLSEPVQANLFAFNSRLAKGMIVYADKVLKDKNLATPMGLEVTGDHNCTPGVNCHSLYLRHPYAKTAKSAVAVQLRALEDVFSGRIPNNSQSRGFGFNDYLTFYIGVENKSINQKMNQSSLSQTWSNLPDGEEYVALFVDHGRDPSPENLIYQSFQEVRELTTWMKDEFIVDLSSRLPGSVQGDND